MYLLIVQLALIRQSVSLWLIPVREQRCSIRLVLRIWRGVGKSDGFVRPRGVGRGAFEERGRGRIAGSDFLRGGEVGGEGWVVGLRDGCLGGGGEAAELGGQVVELLAEVGGTWDTSAVILLPLRLMERTSHHFRLIPPRPRRPRASDPTIWRCVHLGNWARDSGRWLAGVRAVIA